MCSKHHNEFEKLNSRDRIEYIEKYSNVGFTKKIVYRMEALLGKYRPLAIYPKVKIKKQAITRHKPLQKQFFPDEIF